MVQEPSNRLLSWCNLKISNIASEGSFISCSLFSVAFWWQRFRSFLVSFHKGDLFRPYTPASYVPPFRSNSCPPQNDSRHGYPDRPRSNPGTPVSSRGNHDPRRQIYDRNRAPQYNSGGYQGNQSYYNSGGYQGNRSQYNSSNYQGNWSQSNAYSRGPGSSQSQYSRGSYQPSSRDPRQQQQHYNRQGPPNRVSLTIKPNHQI